MCCVGGAGGGTLGDGSGGVPDAGLVAVTVGHGGVLVFARSVAAGSVPLAGVDGGAAGANGLLVAARGLVVVGFAILFAASHWDSGPHAGGVSKAVGFGGVLAGAGGDAGLSSRVDAAAIGVQAVGSVELFAWLNTGLSSSDSVDELAVLVVGAFLDVGLRVLAVAADLAGAGCPGADGACGALRLRSELGAGAHTFSVVAVPRAVVVGGAGLGRVFMEHRAWTRASAFEGPFALSGLAVGLDAVHAALLVADVGGVVVEAPSSAAGTVDLAEAGGADLADAGLVGGVPLAFGVKCASDVVGPLARSVQALSKSGVPLAAGVADAGGFVGGEAESGAA